MYKRSTVPTLIPSFPSLLIPTILVSLLSIRKLLPPGLRVEVLVPVFASCQHLRIHKPFFALSSPLSQYLNAPLSSPLHQSIPRQQRRQPVQDLMCSPARDVEDSGVHRSCERSLLVGGEGVGDDAFLLGGACDFDVRFRGRSW